MDNIALTKKIFTFFGFLILCVLAACGDSDSSSSSHVPVENSERDGFIHILASGNSAVLGTDNESARAMERPQMTVNFDYDYDLGRSLVTCGEYNALMENKADCDGDSLPVTNVTYYDAVLFANERSKSEQLDTAYSYSGINFDESGHCSSLNGLAFKSEANAYRLPTEAEWVLAASRDWNPKTGWNASNSDYELHNVCTAKETEASANVLCDMTGNAMEWVNDWMGTFSDTTITNYVGAPDGGNIGVRVVKGGSFRSDPSSISLYSRGDVYTVTSSTRAEYVGFRLAFGSVPSATWLSSNGVATESPIYLLANSASVKALTGTYQTKLAFRNDVTENLVFVNYMNGSLSITEIQETLNVYHPTISPNGKHVAFCTRGEGVPGKSELYVRDLNATGSNLVKLDVESAAIPRWRVVGGDTEIVYVSSTANNKDMASWQKESTWSVPFNDGKFGTPRKLLDGTFNGGVSEDGTLAVSGARLLRAHVAGDDFAYDTVWYNSEQACNVSLNESLKRTLFLDFGSQTGQEFVGEKYGTHERILIADSTGTLIQSIGAPGGYTFDHTEWASEGLIVATLTNADGAHKKIVLVNTGDSSVTDLADGEELWHPDLWIERGSHASEGDVDLDSAGVYFFYDENNQVVSSSVEIGYRMKDFWQNYKDAEFFAFGSSMLLDAIIADSITAYKALNMGVTLADIHLFDRLIRQYVFPFAIKTKVIAVELTPGLLYRQTAAYFDIVLQYSPGLVYDANHDISGITDIIASNSEEQKLPTNLFSQGYIEGEFLLPSRYWDDTYVSVDTTCMPSDSWVLLNSLEILGKLKESADSLGIKLFVTITPRNPAYRETGSFGMFGPSRTVAHEIIQKVENMGIFIFDENKDGLHDYADSMAYNNVHLSYLGAQQYTARLDSLLKTLK